MKKILTLMILTLFAGCATPTYTTKYGISVYDKTTTLTPSREEIEAVIDYVTNQLTYPSHLNDMDIYLTNKLIYQPQSNGDMIVADGYTDIWNKVIIASLIRTCSADSGLAHELAHVIRGLTHVFHDPDRYHDDKKFWDRVEMIEKQMIKDLCPKDYIHIRVPENYKSGQILGRE